MNSAPLVSVIIPIYNVAPYLRECLDSVINQTYHNLEIILVNDGSTDESEEIAKEYLSDSRVQLISTPNGGLSKARNIGMDKANGEYIYFIDSDDYIDLQFLEEMVSIAQENEVDIVCNEQIVRFSGEIIKKKETTDPILLETNDSSIHIGGAVWRCLFAKSLINRSEVRFLEGKVYEDEGFLYMIFPFCQKFALYCGKPYYYRQRVGSIMDKHKNFRSYDLLDVFESIYIFYKKNNLLKRFQPPYSFLYQSVLGYENEKEYLRRARFLRRKFNLPNPAPHFAKRILMRLKRIIKNLLCIQ